MSDSKYATRDNYWRFILYFKTWQQTSDKLIDKIAQFIYATNSTFILVLEAIYRGDYRNCRKLGIFSRNILFVCSEDLCLFIFQFCGDKRDSGLVSSKLSWTSAWNALVSDSNRFTDLT